MNENIKFTVIIPTCERADTLFHCLRTVVAQDYENLSIIVSDNFSQDNTREIVDSFADPRIKYINTGKRLSMSKNWEFALSTVNDGWVTFLGDDDGLLPASLKKVADLIESTNAHAIRSRICSYSWPGSVRYKNGRLTIPISSGFEVRDSKTWLSKLLKGYAEYPDLPMFYSGGFVCCSLIKQIKSRNDMFFRSSIPDIYSAIAFASIIESYVYSKEPFAIAGHSKHSGGAAVFFGDKGLKDSVLKKFLAENSIIPFHPDIPICADGSYPLSIQAQVYESYLQTKNLRDQTHENMHQQQLEIILATSRRRHEPEDPIREWGKIFATTHGLDYDEIQSKARRKRFVLNLALFPGWISCEINTCHIGSSETRIDNVYEASIIASQIRNSMPSRINNISRVAKRFAEIIWQQVSQ